MVGIKGFEMPKCCAECPMVKYSSTVYCSLTEKTVFDYGEDVEQLGYNCVETDRHPDCPLVEVSEPELVFYGDNRPIAEFKKEYPDVKSKFSANISRQAAIDAIYHHLPCVSRDRERCEE